MHCLRRQMQTVGFKNVPLVSGSAGAEAPTLQLSLGEWLASPVGQPPFPSGSPSR